MTLSPSARRGHTAPTARPQGERSRRGGRLLARCRVSEDGSAFGAGTRSHAVAGRSHTPRGVQAAMHSVRVRDFGRYLTG